MDILQLYRVKNNIFGIILAFVIYACYTIVMQLQRRLTLVTFAETIKFIHRKSLLNQNDFAQTIGVSFSTVSGRKNVKSSFKLCNLKLITVFTENEIYHFLLNNLLSIMKAELLEWSEQCLPSNHLYVGRVGRHG